jgi:TIR domain
MAHDVFISHSAHNREVADAICGALEKAAIRCWVAPRDVRPGRSFPGEITRAIQQSKVFLLVFSGHSNNSEQVLREVQLATDSRLPIIRFRIEDVALTDDLRYFLSTPHWLDALTPPLSTHIARLELAIQELLGQSVEVTGKNVVAEETTEAPAPAVVPAPATVVPSAVAPAMPPPLPVTSPAPPVPVASPAPQKPVAAVAPKPFNPWPLLAIAAVVIVAAIIGVIFLFARSKPSKQQASTNSPPSAQTPAAKPNPASTPARTTKVTQKPVSQPTRAPKVTPAAESQDSSESESVSAFDRAGALKQPSAPKSKPKRQPEEPKSAFDRAGGNIGSDQTAEPSPSN